MPTYAYKCGKCGHTHDELRTIRKRERATLCPVCLGVSVHDSIASMDGQASTDKEYDQPVYSTALGINPKQIPDALRKYPHHEYAPDGRMVLRSHNQRRRVLKELGFKDFDSYY